MIAAIAACALTIPRLRPAAGGGVKVGHVEGSCTFDWAVREQVEYRDGWHVLGVRRYGCAEAGREVRRPAWADSSYHETGEWRLRVVVVGMAGQRLVFLGPVSEFSS